jgi:hypothetical protein
MTVVIDGTTGISSVDGTASNPSYEGTDSNTGIFFPAADTIAFSEGGVEVGRFDSSANFQFNSGYGSVATAYGCRAWVNFNGTAAGTFAGGVSTVTRIAGSTTATVTTTTAHGLITGNAVYALTGVAAGIYTVTFISSTQFSFTTVATTALTAASITFAVNSIRASGNVSSIADIATGEYIINFANSLSDADYVVSGCQGGGNNYAWRTMEDFTARSSSLFRVYMVNASFNPADPVQANFAIFR